MDKQRDGLPIAADRSQDLRVVCHCFHKSVAQIRSEVLRLRLKSPEEVSERLCAGNGCTLCRPDIEAVLADFWEG